MTRILNVHLLPELANPHDLAGHTSVVIDVLRASTTITTALANGAERIIPCLTTDEARQLAADRPGALLGGERHCKKLPGFNFGNSPAEYVRDEVEGKTIVFTTTNGTKAMTRCMGSARIIVGAIVNRAAVCEAIQGDERIDIICAGTNGEFSMDDALGAGAIVEQLSVQDDWRLNDGARLSRQFWAEVNRDGETGIRSSLAISQGGRNLIDAGMDEDVTLAAALNSNRVVPSLDKSDWTIRGLN